MRTWATFVALTAAAAVGSPLGAVAQTYPTRTVTLVVPYPPGGGVDALARVVAKTMADVVAIAKTERAKLNIGTSAVGTGGYLSAELFKSITNTDATIIPYKGTGQVMNDLLGGHVPIAFGVLPPALGNLHAGTLRAIAVLDARRFSLLPDVPTADESGLPGFESVLHYGLLAPAGTPQPIVQRLKAPLRVLVESADVKQRIVAEGGDPLTSTPEEYAKDIDREETKWGTLVRKLNLKVE